MFVGIQYGLNLEPQFFTLKLAKSGMYLAVGCLTQTWGGLMMAYY